MDLGFVFFVLGVVVAILAIGFTPLFILMSRADGLGAKIGLMEAFQLLSRQSTDKEFLKAIALDQSNDLGIGITRLETHLLAGGDPMEVMEALLLAKEIGMEFDFGQLSALQLGGKDLLMAVNRTKEVVNLEITGFELNNLRLDYHAQYRFGIGSVYREPNPSDIERKIRDRLKSFAEDWTIKDSTNTQNFLLKNILNAEYWEKIIGVQLIQHYLEVMTA